VEDYLTEDDQWEAVKRWLKENGAWIIGGVLLGGGGLLGWRWWDGHVTEQAQQASAQYAQLLATLDSGDPQRVQALAEDLGSNYGGTPYAGQAELSLARRHVEAGEFDQAAGRLAALVKDSGDPYLREVARLRLARVELARNKPDEALAVLDRVKNPGAFAAAFNEVRGDALLAAGDRAAARDAYRAALLEAGASGIDASGLQLKLNDLAAPPVEAPSGQGSAEEQTTEEQTTEEGAPQ
jgi:predicted negative regulator of RcsB-dependent stress response